MTNEKVFVYDQEDIKVILESTIRNNQTVQKPLSDEIIRNIDVGVVENCGDDPWMEFARAIEKAHGIG